MSSFALIVLLGFYSGGGFPLGLPPAPEDPVLANVAPEDCLAYLSWAGMAKADPKNSNQLEQLLAEAEVRQLAAEVERRIREGLRKQQADAGPNAVKMVDDITTWLEVAHQPDGRLRGQDREGFTMPTVQAGAVVGLGDDAAKVRAVWERFAKDSPENYHPTTVEGETLWNSRPSRASRRSRAASTGSTSSWASARAKRR